MGSSALGSLQFPGWFQGLELEILYLPPWKPSDRPPVVSVTFGGIGWGKWLLWDQPQALGSCPQALGALDLSMKGTPQWALGEAGP